MLVSRGLMFVTLIPLKQGLKPGVPLAQLVALLFVTLIPLKQGLKLRETTVSSSPQTAFVTLIPLKQGLKL